MTGSGVDHRAVAAYALGALDSTETACFEGHLAGCPPCAEELGRLMPVVLLLARVDPRYLTPCAPVACGGRSPARPRTGASAGPSPGRAGTDLPGPRPGRPSGAAGSGPNRRR